MSLTARVSAFFLTLLAVVLVGFSATLYLMARSYLYRQVDERLDAALQTLSAAVEVGRDRVEWEAHERQLVIGQDGALDQVRWLVHDDAGRVVDRSRNLEGGDLTIGNRPSEETGTQRMERAGQSWQLLQRRVGPTQLGENSQNGDQDDDGPRRKKINTLILTAGLSLEPVETSLRNLALTSAGLTSALWLLAALVGRWLCRQALRPVKRMAATARGINADALEQRLPSPGTGDELEDLGRAFNDLLVRVQEAFERQRRFTGDASHQLRTPLTALLGQIEVVLRRERSATDYRDVLERVHGQAVQLRQIVEMLLFMARADAEARLPNLDTTDLVAWLADYGEQYSERPQAADARFAAATEAPLLAKVHAPLLTQLLDNLLDNARKYSAVDTPITVRLGREGEYVVLSVTDAGTGIPPEDLPHVFEPFYRSAQVRRQGQAGCGLGLAVVQRIALAFGGSVTAWSEAGRGSRFTVRLPAAPAGCVAVAGVGQGTNS